MDKTQYIKDKLRAAKQTSSPGRCRCLLREARYEAEQYVMNAENPESWVVEFLDSTS